VAASFDQVEDSLLTEQKRLAEIRQAIEVQKTMIDELYRVKRNLASTIILKNRDQMETKDKSYYAIDRERWKQLSIFDQMGNIGSEVGRTLKLKRNGEDFQVALIRALDLFDATVEVLVGNKSHRTKEVLRARDQFLQALFIADDPTIETYFMQFAIAARINR
jgi:hypothetical protein